AIHLFAFATNERASAVAAAGDDKTYFLHAGIDQYTSGLVEDTLGQTIVLAQDRLHRGGGILQTLFFFLLREQRSSNGQTERKNTKLSCKFAFHRFVLSRM